MKTKSTAPRTIDDYIAEFPPAVQVILEKIRQTIRKAAPQADETISYQMPTFTLKGQYLVYFAAYKKHVGFYPAPVGQAEFKDALATYASGQGTLKFPLDRPIPYGLFRKIVKFRIKENLAKAAAKGKKKARG
jgi:uncharacterized protein YdhG (YjbR/CyaY superfamily)